MTERLIAMQQAVKSGITGLITFATGENPLLVNAAGGQKQLRALCRLRAFLL